MRFSSVFQPRTLPPPAAPARELARADEAALRTAIPVPAQDLPDDLDARVRLVGEWQLGESY